MSESVVKLYPTLLYLLVFFCAGVEGFFSWVGHWD